MRARAITLLVVGALVVGTAAAPVSAGAPSDERHLDEVLAAVDAVSPQSEGSVWEDTYGNRFPGDDAAWFLQTPDCWGDPTCAGVPPLDLPSGTTRFLEQVTETIAGAEESIDISTLRPFPDEDFYRAVLDGLVAAFAGGDTPTVRILGGSPLLISFVERFSGPLPGAFRAQLVADLTAVYGPAAEDFPIVVASMTSSVVSWNHAKMIIADGQRAIVGGHNLWENSYITRKVSDVSVVVEGPAADLAGRFADVLWGYTCGAGFVWAQVAKPDSLADCPITVDRLPPGTPGDTRVLAVGRLGRGIPIPPPGLGITATDGAQTEDPTPLELACPILDLALDLTYGDPDYDARNPEETAERALLASAEESIFISQQDLLGYCGRYDTRTFDVLADQLLAGTPTTIVVTGAFGTDYAIMKSLYDLSTVLYDVVLAASGDPAVATQAICANLRLASIRAADSETWSGGEKFANHAKFVMVDDRAFSVGSGNIYPFPLQEMNLFVEDPDLAAQIQGAYLDPLWQYSQATAIIDAGQGRCEIFGPGETPPPVVEPPAVPTTPPTSTATPVAAITPRFAG